MAKKIERSPAAVALAKALLEDGNIKSAADVNDALREVCGTLFEALLQGEMDTHLGYSKSDQGDKPTSNRRNGYGTKTIKTRFGEAEIKTPRDRDATFEPQIVPKRTVDVSGIDDKVLAMYARGMSQRDIAKTIEELYGFSLSHEQISVITDRVQGEVDNWQSRPLQPVYPFVFVDCIYANVRDAQGRAMNQAVYVVLGIDAEGHKDVLALQVKPTESKAEWMNLFDTLKVRGVKDILFLAMDGVSGLEDGLKAVFPETTVQRCIVHLMRNSLKYVNREDYRAFTASIKAAYSAPTLQECQKRFDEFVAQWEDRYPGAVRVWQEHRLHVEQLFNYTSAIRKIMYTTNAIESVNSSLRKVTKKGCFESEAAVQKVFYLRIRELKLSWDLKPIPGWVAVRNQLAMYEPLYKRIRAHLPQWC